MRLLQITGTGTALLSCQALIGPTRGPPIGPPYAIKKRSPKPQPSSYSTQMLISYHNVPVNGALLEMTLWGRQHVPMLVPESPISR